MLLAHLQPKPHQVLQETKTSKMEKMETDVKAEEKESESLLSSEKLDRNSPELWPEKMPGIDNFTRKKTLSLQRNSQQQQLQQEDIKMIYQLGNLTTAGLISEIKKIFDEGYQCGCEETKEITRGKYLNIFSNSSRKYK